MKQIHIYNSRKMITLQSLLMHYYTQTALIKVLLNYSDNNLRNIVNIVSISN